MKPRFDANHLHRRPEFAPVQQPVHPNIGVEEKSISVVIASEISKPSMNEPSHASVAEQPVFQDQFDGNLTTPAFSNVLR
jgi:hypothetical protein